MSNALVLGGGSVKGAFQAGVISEVLKKGFVPDAIYGVSVGALNGAVLANEAGKAKLSNAKIDWPAIGDSLLNFWESSITSNKSLGYRYCAPTIAWDIAWHTFDSLMNSDKLKDLIRKIIDAKNLRQNAVKFFAGVVNIGNGEYIDIDCNSQSLIEYIIASAAIPILMPIQKIGGQLLLDGGLRNVAPLSKAVSDGATEIVVVLCQPQKMNSVNIDERKLTSLADRVTDIMTNEIVNNDIKVTTQINEFCEVREKTKLKENFWFKENFWNDKRFINLITVRPDQELEIDTTNFNEDKIKDLMELGQLKGSQVKLPSKPAT